MNATVGFFFGFIVDRDTCIFEIFGMLTSAVTSYFKCKK